MNIKFVMLIVILVLLFGVLAACQPNTSTPQPTETAKPSGGVQVLVSGTVVPKTAVPEVAVNLPDMGQAPEILNQVWVNSDEPVTLASQRGKVVLIEFWTFE